MNYMRSITTLTGCGVLAMTLVFALPSFSAASSSRHAPRGPALVARAAPAQTLSPAQVKAAGQLARSKLAREGASSGVVHLSIAAVNVAVKRGVVSSTRTVEVCRGTTCQRIASKRFRPNVVTYWQTWSVQPSNTRVCDVLAGWFANDTFWHIDQWAGCYTTGPYNVNVFSANPPGLPHKFPRGASLCNRFGPSPPFEGYPCQTV
jgi:hypothetical protein